MTSRLILCNRPGPSTWVRLRRGWPGAELVLAVAGSLLGLSMVGPPALAVPPPAVDALVLEEHWEVDVASDRAAQLRYRNRTRILTSRGAERYGSASIPYNPWMGVQTLRGAVLHSDGKRVAVKRQEILDAAAFASYELYADSRERVLTFPALVPGDVVEYEYELALESLLYLPRVIAFQDELAAELRSLVVRSPASFPLDLVARGGGLVREDLIQAGLRVTTWTARDLAALRFEPAAPPAYDLAARVALYPGQLSFAEHRIDATSWDGISAWYLELARERMVATGEVAARARALVEGATVPAEAIRRVYGFLQGKVHYVAVELGIGGWQPHASDHVLRMQYGDCKDKATLMIAMLRAVGLDGLPALVRTRDAGRLDPDRPSLAFNHVIVAIPRDEGFEFLDPTSEYSSPGDLPWTDQGVSALVVRSDGRGVLVETPIFPAEHNQERRVVDARILPDGALEGTFRLEASGQRQVPLAALLKQSAASERDAALARYVASLCPGAIMQGFEVLPDDGGALRLLIRFRIPRVITHAGGVDLLSLNLASFADIADLGDLASRQQPILFPFLWSVSSEITLRLPDGRSPRRLPENAVAEAAGVRMSASYELVPDGAGSVLVIRRGASLSRRELPVEEVAALRGILDSLRRTEAGAITLQSVP